MLTVLTEACSSKREWWEGEWPDYIDMNEGRIECVLITETPDLAAQLAAVTKQRDILKEALEEIATGAWCIKTCVDVIAPRALQQADAVIWGTK